MTGPDPFAEAAQSDPAREVRETNIDLALRGVMSTPHGRAMVWWLLESCGVYRSSFSAHSDSLTAFNEGGRQIGLILLARIHRLCPERYTQMAAEAAADPAPSQTE
jgi:hypothetical protein